MIQFPADPVLLSTIVIGELGQLDADKTPYLRVLVPSASSPAHIGLIETLAPKLGFTVEVGRYDETQVSSDPTMVYVIDHLDTPR